MPIPLPNLFACTPSLKHFWNSELRITAMGLGSGMAAVALSFTGLLQVPEWALLDAFFRMRPPESIDPRIVVVTIDDIDLSQMGTWPIPDTFLAELLQKLQRAQPRVIGLDLYRDLPVQPGHPTLQSVFATTPNLIGVEKRFGTRRVPPPPILAAKGQVAIVDRVEDGDGRIRRDLVSARSEMGKVYFSLGTRLALTYLAAQGIHLETMTDRKGHYRLGQAMFTAFRSHDGGYVGADDNGYQVLLNFRGDATRFTTVPLRALLTGSVSPEIVRDRVVLIGSTAESTNDFLLTPYDRSETDQFSRTPGVFVHANSVSQMISAAIDGRALIRVLPQPLEELWAIAWSLVGILISRKVLQGGGAEKSYGQALLGAMGLGAGVLMAGYGFFVCGWWVPCFSALLGMAISTSICLLFYERDLHRMAYLDELTQVANRRYFEQHLIRQFQRKGHVSLILCDVDFFKLYNDTYGHQAGDECLMQVAQVLKQSVRRSDLVARYGGEEFAIILPDTPANAAQKIAERIVQQVRNLQVPHRSSQIGEYVTLSCGVACVVVDHPQFRLSERAAHALIAGADQALYHSKTTGRDRSTLAHPNPSDR